MSQDEKVDLTMVIGLIEDELEERTKGIDRRQQQIEEDVQKKIEAERRKNTDRRSMDS